MECCSRWLKLTGYYFGIVVCQMDYIFIDGVAILSLSMTLLQPCITSASKCICKMESKAIVCSLVDFRELLQARILGALQCQHNSAMHCL